MLAIVGALALLSLATAVILYRQSRKIARLERAVQALAIEAATQIAAEGLAQPTTHRPQRRRHLRGLPAGLVGAGAAAGWLAGRIRDHKTVAAGLATAGAAGLLALPLLAVPDTAPELVEPPPPAAAPPLDTYPNLPREPELRPAPKPELEPEPGPGEPEMERVAVELPAEPGPAASPAVPSPAAPAPSPDPPAEATPAPPAPEPTPSPSPVLPPADPPADDDPGLLCADLGLLGLVKLHVCLLP